VIARGGGASFRLKASISARRQGGPSHTPCLTQEFAVQQARARLVSQLMCSGHHSVELGALISVASIDLLAFGHRTFFGPVSDYTDNPSLAQAPSQLPNRDYLHRLMLN
jgi:hypothetical protein